MSSITTSTTSTTSSSSITTTTATSCSASAPKRPRLEEDAESEAVRPVLRPVLCDELFSEALLVEVYIATIRSMSRASQVIVELNRFFPIPHLAHLKRIRGNDVVIGPASVFGGLEELVQAVKESMGALAGQLQDYRKAVVPKCAPRLKLQHRALAAVWPCNFFPNLYLEKLVANTAFTDKELKAHTKYMEIAIDVARFYREQRTLWAERAASDLEPPRDVGVVVVDPVINSVVAVGYDNRLENPVQHAVMMAIDLVARSQGGGAWCSEPAGDEDRSLMTLDGIPVDLFGYLRILHKEVGYGARMFAEGAKSGGPYLCTGYDVYVTHEPCLMCAMGLVHSRAKRVFYGAATKAGALGSACKLHTVKELNHHYEVFAGLLEEKCQSLSDGE